jgi:sulfate adenylyltransferase subunit 2
MTADGRNIKVEVLNERRLAAVKLRLSGVPIAEAAARTGLSQPTVIAAVKAYQGGGWSAVPVGPRGRGIKRVQVPGQQPLSNIKHFKSREPVSSRAAAGPPDASTTLGDPAALTHLQRLEAESIHILREVVAEAANPVMLYSIGKDSSVMLHLARKAFFPAPPPFPLMHVDTGWKFRDMYAFRERMAAESGMRLIVHVNPEGLRMGINPFVHGSAIHTDVMKTEGLKQALDKHGFDAAFGGARRDEEKSRAKERIFSFRSAQHLWDPKNQRPELWKLYNARKHKGESIRVFPLSNWTELDVWQYIHLENIPVVPLYFARQRPVVERDGTLIMVDDDRLPLRDREVPMTKSVRFRTLGCYPLTGAIESQADTLPAIIQEMLLARTSERQGRVIDHDGAASMEKKKREGYF